MNAQRHKVGGLVRVLQGHVGDFQEFVLFQNEVIRRRHDDSCLCRSTACFVGNPMVGVGDARRGVPHERLAQRVFAGQLRQVFCDEAAVAFLGDYEDVLSGDKPRKAVKGHLDQRAPRSQDIEKLLRSGLLAHGPEAASDSAGHDNGVGVLACAHGSVCHAWGASATGFAGADVSDHSGQSHLRWPRCDPHEESTNMSPIKLMGWRSLTTMPGKNTNWHVP